MDDFLIDVVLEVHLFLVTLSQVYEIELIDFPEQMTLLVMNHVARLMMLVHSMRDPIVRK